MAPEISGHEDPTDEAPWAMQLVVRVERDNPPSCSPVCEAAAMATVRLLASPEAQMGDWKPAVDRWLVGRIRKIVRRARGSAFDKVQALPGVSVEHDGALVHALVPGPTDAVPGVVSRLQVSGLELNDPHQRTNASATADALVVSINPAWSLEAHPGKAAAQVAHAAQVAWMEMPDPVRHRWAERSFPVEVEWVSARRWHELREHAPVLITDAGFTLLPANSETTIARW